MKRFYKGISFLLIFTILFGCSFISAFAESHSVSFPAEGDYYIIADSNNNYAIDVSGGGDAPTYTSIQLWEKNDTDAQIFTLLKVSGDWYKIVHKRTGQVINVQKGESYNDARLWLYPYDETDSCHFRFAAVGSSYIIQNKLDSQRVIDLHNAESYNGAIVHLWDTHFGTSARWKLVPVSNKSFSNTPLDKLGEITFIRQGPNTCKATSLAMVLNLITGSNNYTTSKLGNSSCTNINGRNYTDFNAANYTATYRGDSYKGSYAEEKNALIDSLNNGAPAVAAIHATNGKHSQHHWVVVVGRSGDDFLIVDPAKSGSGSISNNVRTMSSCGYDLGLADYSPYHYGYITFTKSGNDSAVNHSPANSYFPKCSSSYTSITDALKSIGVNTSFSYRSKIAEANSITKYSGTASQNIKMLSLLQAGKLIKP